MRIKKIIIGFIFILILALLTGTVYIGSYLVDFALCRGNAKDPKALPQASAMIITANLPPHPKPNYANEIWEISLNNEKRLGTAFYSAKPSKKWIIMVHGYCRDQRYVWYYAAEYLARGYNVLTPDLNASGQSDGKYLTMGVKESQDIIAWIKKLSTKYPDAQIALHGVSMGAATVMLTAEQPLSRQVYAVIEDCGYTSAYDMFGVKLKEVFNIEPFPILYIIDAIHYYKTDVSLSDAAPLKKIKDTSLPMLFIHGTKDKLIPLSMMEKLYDNCGSKAKEKYIVVGAGHAFSMGKDPNKYFDVVTKFLEKYQKY